MLNFTKGDKIQQDFHLSESVYRQFISTFNDKNPLHTDEDFAVDKGFRGKVMHGNILNGFLSYFVGECLPTKNVIIHSQEIQFKNPVYLNQRLLFEAVISEVFDSVGVVEYKFQFKNAEALVVSKGKIQIGILK